MATVKADPHFSAEKAAESFTQALKGFFSADDKTIIKLLASMNNAQRQETIVKYKTMHGKDLVSDLKSKLGGNLEDAVVALMETPAVFDAKSLRAAMKGVGTTEEVLIEILATRTDAQIHAIREAYAALFHRDLESDLASETSGKFKHILVSLVQGNRDESKKIDPGKAKADAQALFQAGEGSWMTDGSEFNRVFMTSNAQQLKLVAMEYEKLSKYTLAHAIQKETSGSFAEALTAMLQTALNPAEYFAERLYRSMHGIGTDDATLIRVVVSRCEVDMAGIKAAFVAKYGKTLAHMIKGDCSGEYRHLLDALIGEPDA